MKTYGWGIVDRKDRPWWDESCVCQDRAPMLETAAILNEANELGNDTSRAPYRSVRLLFAERKRK